jgi:hypothetical protein
MSDERIPKFRITSVDGNTLAIINEEGIVPRGKRADMKLFDESSGYQNSKSLKSIINRIQEATFIEDTETTLKKLGVSIKNEDGTYRDFDDIITDVIQVYGKQEQQERQSKIDKLEELCKPISDYLRENYDPYYSVVITDDSIRLTQDQIGIPVNVDYEKEDESCSDPRVSMEEAISNIVSFLSKTKIGYELN